MSQEPSEEKRAFFFTATVLVVLMLVALLAQLPRDSMPDELSHRAASYELLWPQGWSFFSDAPHQDRIVAYHVEPDGDLSTEDSLQARPGSLWGLRRTTYFRLVETEYIASRIPRSSWIACSTPTAPSCLRQSDEPVWQEMENPFHASALCGRVLFAVERPDLGSGQIRGGEVPRRVVTIAPTSLRCVPERKH
jgi:antimicrobial peptide system SdpA family protein